MTPKIILPSIAATAVIISLWFGPATQTTDAPALAHETRHETPGSPSPPELTQPAVVTQENPRLPAELAETLSYVSLEVDSLGNLVPNADLRQLFDMYLSALQEHSQEQVLQWLDQALSETLSGRPQALDQARNLLDRYITYRLAVGELAETSAPSLTPDGFDLEVLRYRQQQLQALRNSHFVATESDAFFGLEAVQDRYTLEYLSVSHSGNLSETQKRQALEALEQTLPAQLRELRHRTTRHADVYDLARSLREGGASPAEIYQARAETLGDEAAANLAELDQQRADWQRRLRAFSAEKTKITRQNLPARAEAEAIAMLIQRNFSGTERLRVQALAPEL
ncbi:hypothetical protein LPB19_14220 [Marinobacter salinisoli]|uniref:Lipase chaperone n=1 Tax=Marinobacter salinisoli TaxID=2769486 RepID=A0ABX7MS48_9GAMM|nr:lipase secretion chaperone [Marinobacter salinisoli]QSP94322.1 hypothetical protein LPB19_14220 [Marinobacter salinisoli]